MDFYALQGNLTAVQKGCITNTVTSIEGSYTLIEQVGHGAYGVVWKARRRVKHCGADDLFAVKQIHMRRAGTKGMKEVLGEVETMSMLSHVNLVKLEETFQDETFLWIVMEYLAGGTLQDTQQRQHTLAEGACRQYLQQLLLAVDYMHEKGIVHRDLKLSNCLLTTDGATVKVSDFGFAVLGGSEQCLSTYCGTVAYMAPEILRNQHYGKPVDMWALGVITYVLFVGEYPFTGGNHSAVVRAICRSRQWMENDRLRGAPLLLDFLSQLLAVDVGRRLTAKQALQHPWMKQSVTTSALGPASPLSAVYYAVSPFTHTGGAVGLAHATNVGFGRRHSRASLSRLGVWRSASIAVMAVHRLCYLQHCRRLAKAGLAHCVVLRDYHYAITRVYEPATCSLNCSTVFQRRPLGILELLPMIDSCTYLEHLDLSDNHIDSLDVVQRILKSVAKHPRLHTLVLSGNPLPPVAGRGLLRLVRSPSCRLRRIDLEDTSITSDIVAQIHTLLRERATSSGAPQLVQPSSSSPSPSSASPAPGVPAAGCNASTPGSFLHDSISLSGIGRSGMGGGSRMLSSSVSINSVMQGNGKRESLGHSTAHHSHPSATHGHPATRLPPLPQAAFSRRGREAQ